MSNQENEKVILAGVYETSVRSAGTMEDFMHSMDELEDAGNLSWMGSYNNSKAEVAFLNDILADTLQYSISFADVTRSGDQIRRNFTLQFRTADYAAMRKVIDGLLTSPYRCLVGDIQCSMGQERDGAGYVSANVTATFFETMEGGTPDAGLPEDRGTAQ